MSENGSGKKVAAKLVADVPGVDVQHPALYLVIRDFSRVVDQGGEDPRFVDLCVPELVGQVMAAADSLGHLPKDGHGDTKGSRRADPIAGHSGDVGRIGLIFESVDHLTACDAVQFGSGLPG